MDKITVDSSLCVGCGKCVKDCVAFALYLENGKAKVREGTQGRYLYDYRLSRR